MVESLEGVVERFALRHGPPASLHATGLRHPPSLASGSSGFTSYADLTHVVLGARALRIASREGVIALRRNAFVAPEGAEALAAALQRRIEALPGGGAQRARMLALDARLAVAPKTPLSRGLVLLCLAAFGLQLFVPGFESEGLFSAALVRAGELWRLVTANFLHGGAAHLALNVLCLLVLGGLLERMLGSRPAGFVMATSGVGAMLGSLLADYGAALGASGIVAGVVGALLWLEFRRPAQIPAPWRLPRRLLLVAAVLEFVGLLAVPGIAHAAHLGGLISGVAAAALVSPAADAALPRRRWLDAAALAAAGGLALSLVALGWAVASPEAAARRAARLLTLEDVPAQLLNNQAWLIAIASDPDERLLAVALRLAERAVAETGRADPNLLDTLAEVQFVSGDPEGALETIDEAIELAPDEPYFHEQRRRFTGERPADDRPDPPQQEPLPRLEPSEPEPSPGLRV